MKANRLERNRTFALFLLITGWVLFAAFTLVRLQVFNYNKYVAKVKSQSKSILKLHPRRGTIYDRNGEILAISVQAKSAFLSAKNRKACLRLFPELCRVIKLGYKERKNIRSRILRKENFIWLKRKLSDKNYEKLLSLRKKLNDSSVLGFLDEYRRIYPQGKIAAHILGGVGIDEQGLFGIEKGVDDIVRGKGGRARVKRDARRKIFSLEYLDPPRSGHDIFLTIDASVQFQVEKELARYVRKFNARGGAAVIMDSRDGSILAMASYPGYFPEKVARTPYRIIKNKALSMLYEPGSTFKVILASAALENSVCFPGQVFDCHNGVFVCKGKKIEDVHPYKKLSFREIIVKSSNVGAAQVGLVLGPERYYRILRDYRFGEKSNLKLPAEESGILRPLKKWSDVSVAFLSFGYEILVTPLQMTRSFNAVASGGILWEPRILNKISGIAVSGPRGERVISKKTALTLAGIMGDVVSRGTGRKSHMNDLAVAGKTGTAKKAKNGRYQKDYVSSFGGFFPLSNPRMTLFVVVDEPKREYYGGDVAAPLFKAITEKIQIQKGIYINRKIGMI